MCLVRVPTFGTTDAPKIIPRPPQVSARIQARASRFSNTQLSPQGASLFAAWAQAPVWRPHIPESTNYRCNPLHAGELVWAWTRARRHP
eukprot:11059712-Alexandrium_andersonii.AAC.1